MTATLLCQLSTGGPGRSTLLLAAITLIVLMVLAVLYTSSERKRLRSALTLMGAFALSTVDKTASPASQGFATAGQKPPALDMATVPPSEPLTRANRLSEPPLSVEVVT